MAVYLKGERADDSSALERAAELFGRARLPVISGLMTDIAGAEAALALAPKLDGVIDHAAGEALSWTARLMREAGGCPANFGEVRNPADFVVMLGDAPLARDPVLLLDLFPAEPGLPRPGDNRRELIVFGTSEVKDESRLSVTTIPLGDADLPTLIAMLGLVSERRLRADAKCVDPKLVKLAERLRSAAFAVFVYSTPDSDEPTMHSVLGLMRLRN
jgi:formylmethanofuran dehydrogenase subunit B